VLNVQFPSLKPEVASVLQVSFVNPVPHTPNNEAAERDPHASKPIPVKNVNLRI
jgi:hypothetical protein